MEDKLEKDIVQKYPSFFDINSDREPGTPFYPIAFGFECGDGWYKLIADLCETINKLQTEYNNTHEEKMDIKVTQVKEKYGSLRVYVDGATKDIYNAISIAENLSYMTCETCGSTTDVGSTIGGWIVTSCKVCQEKTSNGLIGWKLNKEQYDANK